MADIEGSVKSGFLFTLGSVLLVVVIVVVVSILHARTPAGMSVMDTAKNKIAGNPGQSLNGLQSDPTIKAAISAKTIPPPPMGGLWSWNGVAWNPSAQPPIRA